MEGRYMHTVLKHTSGPQSKKNTDLSPLQISAHPLIVYETLDMLTLSESHKGGIVR